MLGNDIVVAIQAFSHRGNSWIRGPADIGVTELTLNFFYAGMQAMAEWYRLFRTDLGSGRCIEIIQKGSHENNTGNAQHNGFYIARRGVFITSRDDILH